MSIRPMGTPASALAGTYAPLASPAFTGTPTVNGSPLGAADAAALGWSDFVADYGADPTGVTGGQAAKIQQWITDHPNGGTLYVPEGVYLCDDAQQTGTALTRAYSGQVLLPARTLAQSRVVYRIVGPTSPPLVQWGPQAGQSEPVATGGAILRSTASSGAFMDTVPGFTYNGLIFSNVQVEFDKITVRMPNNPAASALMLRTAIAMSTDRVSIDVNAAAGSVSQPTTATQYGIWAPDEGNGAYVDLKRTQVIGQYTGLRHSEHATLDQFTAQLCRVGILPGAVPHAAVYNRVLLQVNNTHLKASPSVANISGFVAFESKTTGGWWTTTYDIDDTTGYLLGTLFWEKNGLSSSTLLLNGAKDLQLRQYGQTLPGTILGETIYNPTTKATITPGASLALADTTNAAVTFDPPVNGRVDIDVSCTAATGTGNLYLGLFLNGSLVAGTEQLVAATTNAYFNAKHRFRLTGLGGGAAVTYKLAVAQTGSSGALQWGGSGISGGNAAAVPLVMTAIAAP